MFNESHVPMSTIAMDISVDEFVIAESVKLVFSATIVLSGEFAEVDPKATVLSAAEKIVPGGEWYVTSANRSEGQGGLEVVVYTLNVRVKDAAITKAKNALKDANGKQGLKFALTATDYTPTQKQLEDAAKELRKKVYARSVEEQTLLNESLKGNDEDWLVGDIQFGGQAVQKNLRAASTMYNSRVAFAEAAGGGAGDDEEDAGITQKVSLQASVTFVRKIYSRL